MFVGTVFGRLRLFGEVSCTWFAHYSHFFKQTARPTAKENELGTRLANDDT